MEKIPRIQIPTVEKIQTISIPLPTADVPSYVPLVVPPSVILENQRVHNQLLKKLQNNQHRASIYQWLT